MFVLLGLSVHYLWSASRKRMAAQNRGRASVAPPKADLLRTEVKNIENSAKKKGNKMNTMSRSEAAKTKEQCDLLKPEVERVTKANEAGGNQESVGWEQQAVIISERMKQIVQREADAQHLLVVKADEAMKEIDFRSQNVRRELPLVLDFSEQDRVTLASTLEKSVNELKLKKAHFEEREAKLQKQMELLIHNTPDPVANKEELIAKLKISYEVLSGSNDPEVVRQEVLKVLSTDKIDAGPATAKPKPNATKTTPHKKSTGPTSIKKP